MTRESPLVRNRRSEYADQFSVRATV